MGSPVARFQSVLTEKNIKDIMRKTGAKHSCCNDHWPEEFAREVEKKFLEN